jgi:hypothetical protein
VEVVHARCAGLDILKKDAKVCVRVAGAARRKTVETVTTWSSMTSQILALREHLIAERITCAVMEDSSDYWKPFYYLLEDAGFAVLLVNSRHVRNLPGRKTDSAVLLSCWALVGEQDVVAMFQAARDSEYEEILDKCRDFHAGLDKEYAANHFTYGELEENEVEMVKLWNWYSRCRPATSTQNRNASRPWRRSTPAKKHWRSTQPGYMSQRMREARSG